MHVYKIPTQDLWQGYITVCSEIHGQICPCIRLCMCAIVYMFMQLYACSVTLYRLVSCLLTIANLTRFTMEWNP